MANKEIERARLEGYEEVLKDISTGLSIDSIRAKLSSRSRMSLTEIGIWKFWHWKFWSFLGSSLTTITSIVVGIAGLAVAVGGIFFSYFQYQQNEVKTASDEKVAKADMINKLAPSLTSENIQIRTIAFNTLLKLKLVSTSELFDLVDPDVLIKLADKYEDEVGRKKASEELTNRAEHERNEAARVNEKKEYDAGTKMLKSAEEKLEKAIRFDSANFYAKYQLARVEQELGETDRPVKFYEEIRDKFPENSETRLKVNLNLALLYDKQNDGRKCDKVRETVSLYEIRGENKDLAKGEKTFHDVWKKCDPIGEAAFVFRETDYVKPNTENK